MSNHCLTDEQIAQFRSQSHLVFESLFGRDDLDRIDNAIEAVTREAMESSEPDKYLEMEPDAVSGEKTPRRYHNPFDLHDAFRDLATDGRILDRIESLIGPDIALHHSKLNMKPARVGSVVEWHQDLSYFPHTNDDLVTTLVYLDDANEENGCLQVIPGQHTRWLNHHLPDGTFAGMITESLNDGRHGQPVPLAAPAGSAIFIHSNTPHSSLPNRSAKPRRTLIYTYRAADAFAIYAGEYTHLLEQHAHHVRGEHARAARFSGPAPLIPNMSDGKFKSLYTLQDEARTAGSLSDLR